MGNIDRVLQVGSWFDWISPTAAWLQNWFGGMGRISFTPPPGFCELDVRDVIRAMGVQTGVMHGNPLGEGAVLNVSDEDRAFQIIDGLWNGQIVIHRGFFGGIKDAYWRR